MVLLYLNVSSFLQTSGKARICDASLFMLTKWLIRCAAPESTRLRLLCFIFARARTDPIWCIATISGLEMLNPNFQAASSKAFTRALCGMNYFQSYSPFPPHVK